MVTDKQVQLLRLKMAQKKTIEAAAVAAGMSPRSAHNWKTGSFPSRANRFPASQIRAVTARARAARDGVYDMLAASEHRGVTRVRISPIVISRLGHRDHVIGRVIGAERRGLSRLSCRSWS
jgi:hypothetical protein